jgi:hypothetical protein
MKIKLALTSFTFTFTFAFVVSHLALGSSARGETVVTPDFSRPSKVDGRAELDQDGWGKYRSKVFESVVHQNRDIQQLLRTVTGQQGLGDVGPMDSNQRAMLGIIISAMRGAIGSLQVMADERQVVKEAFGKAVSNARQLCIQTSSWTCYPESGEFQLQCSGAGSETCRVQVQIEDGAKMIAQAIEISRGILRELESH